MNPRVYCAHNAPHDCTVRGPGPLTSCPIDHTETISIQYTVIIRRFCYFSKRDIAPTSLNILLITSKANVRDLKAHFTSRGTLPTSYKPSRTTPVDYCPKNPLCQFFVRLLAWAQYCRVWLLNSYISNFYVVHHAEALSGESAITLLRENCVSFN